MPKPMNLLKLVTPHIAKHLVPGSATYDKALHRQAGQLYVYVVELAKYAALTPVEVANIKKQHTGKVDDVKVLPILADVPECALVVKQLTLKEAENPLHMYVQETLELVEKMLRAINAVGSQSVFNKALKHHYSKQVENLFTILDVENIVAKAFVPYVQALIQQ